MPSIRSAPSTEGPARPLGLNSFPQLPSRPDGEGAFRLAGVSTLGILAHPGDAGPGPADWPPRSLTKTEG